LTSERHREQARVWQLTENYRFGSLPRAEYAPPALDTRNFPPEQAGPREDSGVPTAHSCRDEPHLLPHNHLFGHCSVPPPSAPDFATAIGVLPARCKNGTWGVRRPRLCNGQQTSGLAAFGRGCREEGTSPWGMRPPDLRGCHPLGWRRLCQETRRVCAPQGFVFFIYLQEYFIFPLWRPGFVNRAVESASTNQSRRS
jgi:hypothetical protein